MFTRLKRKELQNALLRSPAVVLLGPRQVGKTTLALDVALAAAGQVLFCRGLIGFFSKLGNCMFAKWPGRTTLQDVSVTRFWFIWCDAEDDDVAACCCAHGLLQTGSKGLAVTDGLIGGCYHQNRVLTVGRG